MVVNVDTFGANGYSVAAGYNRTSSVGVGSASGGSTSVTTSGISGMAGNAQVRTGDGSNALTPSWVADELLRDVNAQVRITSTASGVVVQMTPQIVGQLNALLAGGSTSGRMAPNEIDRTREEFDRLQNDPRLTPEQKQQLQTLQSVFDGLMGLIGLGQSTASAPGGPDAVVGGAGSDNTLVVFPLAGLGAAGVGAGTAAGAGVAGLDGASGASQGYRDPESGQWVGGSPPLTLPSLPSLEQLAATNPVIGPVYRVYAAMAQAMANTMLSEDGNKPSLLDPKGESHILGGDATGGGHRFGTGIPGKSEFPEGWSDEKIAGEISDVATDPSSSRAPAGRGRSIVRGTRDGIDIEVIVEPGGRIVTGYPTNVPRNPK